MLLTSYEGIRVANFIAIKFENQLSVHMDKCWAARRKKSVTLSVGHVLQGRDTRQEDVEGSPTQSRISPSMQRTLRVVPTVGSVEYPRPGYSRNASEVTCVE